MMNRRWSPIALMLVLFLLAAGCRAGENPAMEGAPGSKAAPAFPADSYMAEIQRRGSVRIGVKFDVPQFGLLNPATQQAEGFDIDVGNVIAERLGVRPEYIEAVSANRIPFLNEDKVDLIISTMTINEERRQQIDFSNVYYVAKQTLLVRSGSRVSDVRTLNDVRGNVCTASGSTSERNIRVAAPNANVILQPQYSHCFQLLQNGQVDAVTTDDVILLGFAKQDPATYKLVGEPFSQEPYGMGIKKGRAGFKEFVDGALRDIKQDGTWVRLYDKWVRPITGTSAQPPADDVPAVAPTPPA
ncbi:MAG: glutamate ABC transporter substrate-binding protein [Actinomycetota bacterium]|nr:glutamate ABC transporter substrate-binding protein [Actinomycetota bacterium]